MVSVADTRLRACLPASTAEGIARAIEYAITRLGMPFPPELIQQARDASVCDDGFTAAERGFLSALQAVRFMIVGSVSAALQGAAIKAHDIDLWIDPLFDVAELKRKHLERVSGGSVVNVSRIDVVWNMDGLGSFDAEYQAAVPLTLEGIDVHLLPLDRIIASKRAANRPKDLAALAVLCPSLPAQP